MPRVNWVMGVLPSMKTKLTPDRVFYPDRENISKFGSKLGYD